MSDLSVEVLENGLRVFQRGTHYSVTYLRTLGSPLLESRELLAIPEIDFAEASFLAKAWNAAFDKAKELDWI